MKKVLLSSTALVFAAGVASAEMSMSGSAEIVYQKLRYCLYLNPGAENEANTQRRTDVDISMSGGNGDISYSATLELDEVGTAMGPVTVSMGGLTVVYDKNGLS